MSTVFPNHLDVIRHLLTFMRRKDQHALSLASKEVFRLVWRARDRQSINVLIRSSNVLQVVNYFKQFSIVPYIHTLALRLSKVVVPRRLSNDQFAALMKKNNKAIVATEASFVALTVLSSLRTLKVCSTNSSFSLQPLTPLTNLLELSLRVSAFYEDSIPSALYWPEMEALKKLTSLRRFRISEQILPIPRVDGFLSGISPLLEGLIPLRQLESLELDFAHAPTNLSPLVPAMPALTRLSWKTASFRTSLEGFSFSALRKLTIQGPVRFSSTMLQPLSFLETLTLVGSPDPHISYDSLTAPLSFPHLTEFSGPPDFLHHSLVPRLKRIPSVFGGLSDGISLPSLEYLSLRFAGEGLPAALASFTRLEELSITWQATPSFRRRVLRFSSPPPVTELDFRFLQGLPIKKFSFGRAFEGEALPTLCWLCPLQGSLEFLATLTQLTHLCLANCHFEQEDDPRCLSSLQNLREMSLDGTTWGSPLIPFLPYDVLPSLTSLVLLNRVVLDERLTILASSFSLKSIRNACIRVKDLNVLTVLAHLHDLHFMKDQTLTWRLFDGTENVKKGIAGLINSREG